MGDNSMINEFIDKTIKFLKTSDIHIHLPGHIKLEVGKTLIIYAELSDDCHQMKIEDNLIFHTIIFFTLMDALIDNNYPSMEGLSFRKKYDGLPCNSDLEIISKEIYRILKIFRNASIHAKTSISVIHNTDILIDYNHIKTNYKLHITKTSLELIYTCIFVIIGDYGYTKDYKMGIIRSIYDEINYGTIDIQDDLGPNKLVDISNKLRLKRIVRYKILNPIWREDSTNGVITITKHSLHPNEIGIYSCDYLINYLGNKYLIPDETLKTDGSIAIAGISSWKI